VKKTQKTISGNLPMHSSDSELVRADSCLHQSPMKLHPLLPAVRLMWSRLFWLQTHAPIWILMANKPRHRLQIIHKSASSTPSPSKKII
jgi:hypothetical protein